MNLKSSIGQKEITVFTLCNVKHASIKLDGGKKGERNVAADVRLSLHVPTISSSIFVKINSFFHASPVLACPVFLVTQSESWLVQM